ncbi:uncharacterized protein M421DRAFT_10171 [Didymella exigua CBS 183.55]|uniref:Uncharacterized protein n=1 Tax=Didymella exigua CBS 183.55 TaxID=1150837 RepID=A0A6A5R7Y1_9PLEO|nr:uncharacterized protein M421DRAFT_10171 [Didymella exigua CBS 183.55]KAF1922816.1 hypothetical protein M421DRAFT_10171 [Didymella exigua CBS 183.55]
MLAPRGRSTPTAPITLSMQMMTSETGPFGSQGLPGHSTESLEQRIYGLFAPVREMKEDHQDHHGLPPKNVAFLIRRNYSAHSKHINPNDISLVTKNWAAIHSGE